MQTRNIAVPASLRDHADDAADIAAGQCYCDVPPPACELWAQDNGASDDTLEMVRWIAAENPRQDIDVEALLFALAKPESGFSMKCIGGAGERGLLQCHPCHQAAMRRAGLDWTDEHDRLTFCLRCLIFPHLDAGQSLRRALSAWPNTRGRALRDYVAISGRDA